MMNNTGMVGQNSNKLGQPKIQLQDTEQVVCEKCGGKVFQEGLMLRRIPALLTGQGKPGIVPIPTFFCAECGHVNKEFLPQEFTEGDKA